MRLDRAVWDILMMASPFVICILLSFLLVFIVYSLAFGVPCWVSDSGIINDSMTREIINRCNLK